ncbi:unnamed protein product [Lampetra fluviatilis]
MPPPTSPADSSALWAPSSPALLRLLPWLLVTLLAPAATAMPDQVPFPAHNDTLTTTQNYSMLRPVNASSSQETSGSNLTSVLSTPLETAQLEDSHRRAPEVPLNVSPSTPVYVHEFPSPPGQNQSAPLATDHSVLADGAGDMPGATAQPHNNAHSDDNQGNVFGSSGDGSPTENPQHFKIVEMVNPVTSKIERSPEFVQAFEKDDLVVQELQSFEKMDISEPRHGRESNEVYTAKTEVVTVTKVLPKDTTTSGLLTDAITIAIPPMPTKQEATEKNSEPSLTAQGEESFGNLEDIELKTSAIKTESVEGFEPYNEGSLNVGLPFIRNTEVKDALESTASTVTSMEEPWFNMTEAPSSEGEVLSEGWKGDGLVDVDDKDASLVGNEDANDHATNSKTQLEAPNVGNSSETYADFGDTGEIYDGVDSKGTLQLEDSSKDSDSYWSRRSTADPDLEESRESWFVTTVTDMQPRTPEAEELAPPITRGPAAINDDDDDYGDVNNLTYGDGSLSAEPTTSQISSSSGPVDTIAPWDEAKSKGKAVAASDAASSFELVDGVRKCRPGYAPHNASCISVCATTPHYCYNNGRCYLVENLGAICRCSAQEYSWYKGARCQSVVTDFQVGCVAVGTALLVLFLIFMLIVFFAKKLHSLSTENQQLRAKSLPKCQLEVGADNFSLSTVAVESCMPPPPRKSCQESPSLLPSARALNYYDNMLCTDDPSQKQEKNGESGAITVGHGKPLNASASAGHPPHVPHAKPENTSDDKPSDSRSFQNNLA